MKADKKAGENGGGTVITVLSVAEAEGARGKYTAELCISDGIREERRTLLLFRWFCRLYAGDGAMPDTDGLPFTGEILSQERCDALLLASEASDAAVKAAGILAYGDCTEKMLFEKLRRKGFSAEASAGAVRWADEKRYIREEDYLERFMHSLCEKKRYGIRRIRQEVYNKRFSAELVKERFAEIAETLDFRGALDERIARLPARALDDPEQRRRTTASLLRYGFTPDEITAAIKSR